MGNVRKKLDFMKGIFLGGGEGDEGGSYSVQRE